MQEVLVNLSDLARLSYIEPYHLPLTVLVDDLGSTRSYAWKRKGSYVEVMQQ